MNLINRTLNTIARIPFIKKRFPILHKGIKHYGSELSVCYAITVCDEDDELRNLLDAIIPYKSERDEILIQGDKGNTTEEVLRVIEEYKAYIKKYIEYPLNHNFGAFKSNLKNFTKCDYIFQLDADEIPSPFLMKHLHNILFDNPYDLIRLARINVMINDEEPFLLWKTYDKHSIILTISAVYIKTHRLSIGFTTFTRDLWATKQLPICHQRPNIVYFTANTGKNR